MINIKSYIILSLHLVIISHLQAKEKNSDTLTSHKHFVKPTIYFNSFGSGKQAFRNNTSNSYRWRQNNIGAYFPIFTNTKFSESNIQSSFQMIGFANFLNSKPEFSFIENNHVLTRLNVGLNTIYTSGKSTFLVTLSPFKAQDKNSLKTSDWRMSWMAIYNYTFNESFSVRIGYIRSFVLDGYPNLPLIGFRLGRYDKVHLNAQFPRNICLTMPIKQHLFLNIYARTTGSIYNMKDVNVASVNYSNLVFRRNDFQRGIELAYKKNNQFSFSGGIGSVLGNVKLIERNSFNFSGNAYTIIGGRLRRSGFITIGVQYSFGSSKKVFNNFAMQDAIFLSKQASGDSNPQNNIPTQINTDNLKLKKVQIRDIEEMIDIDDMN